MKRYALCMVGLAMCFMLLVAIQAQAQSTAIKVLTPAEGEQWNMGKTYSIQWKTTGTVDKVQIQLVKGDKVISTIAKDLKNKGDFLWAVPDNLPLTVEEKQGTNIRVMSADGKVVGNSGKFKIVRVQ